MKGLISLLKQFVESVLVIMILAAFLQIVLPPGGMRRYAQLAVGLIMVVTLLNPLLALLRTPFSLSDLLGQAKLQTAWEELRVKGQLLQQQNDQTLLQSYRQVLAEQVREVVEQSGDAVMQDCRFELVEDRQADDFGRILSLSVVVRWAESVVQPVSSVQPVQTGQPAQPPTESSGPQTEATRNRLVSHFALDADQVRVTSK